MARAGMSDEEMTAFIKETFCVDSTYKAADLFAAAELPPSWQTVCTKLVLSTTRGTELLQNALLAESDARRDGQGRARGASGEGQRRHCAAGARLDGRLRGGDG